MKKANCLLGRLSVIASVKVLLLLPVPDCGILSATFT